MMGHISGLLICVVALICGASGQALTDPTILTSPETIQQGVGSAGVLQCRVQDLGNYKVTWAFVTHDFVIFEGDTLMTDHPTKYKLLQTSGFTHDLQILDIQLSDQGFYKCSAGPESIISHLIVLGADALPTPEDPENINVTDCCIAKNVSAGCLPACYPPRIDLSQFNLVELCSSDHDAVSIMECLAGGSNHDTCCLSRGVAEQCLDFCHSSVENLSMQHLVCLSDVQVNALLSCAVTGAEILPGPPTSVTAAEINTGSPEILVKWAPPEKNAEAVIGYKIMYRAVTQSTYKSILINGTNTYMRQLTAEGEQIKADMGYVIHVAALAQHGVSLGSVEIELYVNNASLYDAMNEEINDCCERHNVDKDCIGMLCHSKTWSEFRATNALSCYPSLGSVFKCLAGERDNTGCCEAFEVTSACLPLCSGVPPNFDDTLAECVVQMNIIQACTHQGFKFQPAPPTNLKVDHTTNNLALMSFDPSPTSNLVQYTVQLRSNSLSEPFQFLKKLDPSTTTLELENLAPSSLYWVRIIAETAEEGSLPSETVSFKTYSDSFVEPVEIPARLDPYDFRQCCDDANMPEICSDGCYYRPNMTDYYRLHPECFPHIGSVLTCASDGRDHRPCCKSREIVEVCEDLCVRNKHDPLEDKYLPVCVPETYKAILCFNEGLLTLPRYPDVVVTDVSFHTISLNWSHPVSGAIVDFYEIHYREVDDLWNETITRKTDRFDYIIQDLQAGTGYNIYVFSFNENGSSQATPEIIVHTLQDFNQTISINITDEQQGQVFWKSVEECCDNTVSEQCRGLCKNEQSAADHKDACFSKSTAMLACYSDGYDHRGCCEERDLPSECLPICAGNSQISAITEATCMSYTHHDIIYSCFMERRGLVPGEPFSFSAERSILADNNVTLSWAVPEKCYSNCSYTIHYWPLTDADNKTMLQVTSTLVDVTVDALDQTYYFMVTARNSYGSGPPSVTRVVPMRSWARDVKVYLNGGALTVEQGQQAVLVCSISGFPQEIRDMQVRWLFNNAKEIVSSRFLYLTDIALENEGTYTCEVTDYFTTSSASFYLPIKAAPRFDQMKVESIPPGVMGKAAKMACWFRGFPDSDKNAWTKDGLPLEHNPTKLSMGLDQRYHTGITSYRLKIADVTERDYGDYSITVRNKFGSTTCHVALRNPDDEDQIITAPAVSNPPECCAERGVSSLCQELCGYHVDVAQVLADVRYINCLQHFDTFISCGADGRDHTKCCQESAVLPFCQPMCRGSVPASVETEQAQLLECLGDWQPIIQCMEKGTKNVPFSPVNITLSVTNDGKDIIVQWNQPLLAADKVDHYSIYYSKIGSEGPAISTNVPVHVSQNVLRYRLKGLEPMKYYDIWMTSGNKFGNSLPSSKKRIEAFSFALNRPTNLNVTHLPGGTDVNLSWNMKKQEYYYSYTISYRRVADQFYQKIHNIQDTTYTFTGLEAKMIYLVFVEGVGPVLSRRSDTIEFITQGQGGQKAQPKKDDFDGDKIAIGVGVTVAVIALIAAVLLVLFFVFRARIVPPKVDDTVAYENPRFGSNASVKMRGLAGSSFDYDHLEEDTVSQGQDPAYVYDIGGVANNNDGSGQAVMTGESSTDPDPDPPGYENPMYLQSNAGDVSTMSDGAGNESVATLELTNHG